MGSRLGLCGGVGTGAGPGLQLRQELSSSAISMTGRASPDGALRVNRCWVPPSTLAPPGTDKLSGFLSWT